MKVLAIDTCSNACTAAVVEDNKLIMQAVINNKKTHSEKLMPMIEFMLSNAEISLEDIDLIAVANGPGSFTGVRIGVATAQGLSHALGIPHVGISSLEGLAANVFETNGIIVPILNARREQVYTAMFRYKNSELVRLSEDMNVALSDLLNELVGDDALGVPQTSETYPIIFLGDGIFEFRAEIEEKLGDKALFAPPQANMNSAASIADRAIAYVHKNGEIPIDNIVVPNYLRLSQAERELKEKGENNA